MGLSPTITKWQDENSTQPHLPSPFMGLVNSGTLDRNIFSLLLPYDRKGVGDLSFGTYHPELFSGPLMSHPIYPADAPFWQIEASDVSLRHRNGTEIFNHSLAGRTASLDSMINGIYLSWDLSNQIYAAVNMTQEPDCSVWQVPCDSVADLPELVLRFGEQDIILRAEDYIVETDRLFCFRGPFCMLQVYGDFYETGAIVLGTDFLKNVYAVFDWDEQTVSFAKPNHDGLVKSVATVAELSTQYDKGLDRSPPPRSFGELGDEGEYQANKYTKERGALPIADRYPWGRSLYT